MKYVVTFILLILNWSSQSTPINPNAIISVFEEETLNQDSCRPSPCGLNSICLEVNTIPICRCLPEYIGTPPNCIAECTTDTDCTNQKCINHKCVSESNYLKKRNKYG